MKKRQFIELCQISLSGGIPAAKDEGKFHELVIEKHIGMAYNELVSQIKDTSILDQFASVYPNVPVLYSEMYDLKYSELPSGLINTVFASGLRHVSQMKNQSNVFLLRKNYSQTTMANLEISKALNQNTARIEGNRIYYDQINHNIERVLIKLLQRFEDIGDEIDIEMPGGKDGQVFQMVMALMNEQKLTPTSMKNDNNPNTK